MLTFYALLKLQARGKRVRKFCKCFVARGVKCKVKKDLKTVGSVVCVRACGGGGEINSLHCAVGAFRKARISEASSRLDVFCVVVASVLCPPVQ